MPLIHTQISAPTDNTPTLRIDADGATVNLIQGTDVEFSTTRPVTQAVIVNAPIVFVGHGAFAPERNWDDFSDIDLRGKLAIFLVNDPDFAAREDEAVAGRFGGKRMTYYGRWTAKFEEAARRGALAALVVHDDAGAGYGWNVASSSPGETTQLNALPMASSRLCFRDGFITMRRASCLRLRGFLSKSSDGSRALMPSRPLSSRE